MKQSILGIEFPNSGDPVNGSAYGVGKMGVTEIKRIDKKGPMDFEPWFQILQGEVVLAEIKESTCNVYYSPPEALSSQDGLEVSEEPLPKSINRNQE